MENIPTSTVRGLALGLAELIGAANVMSPDGAAFKSPLSESECVYFDFTVERYVRSGKSGHWQTIAEGDSSICPFWLCDETGKIPVLPEGAEIMLGAGYDYTTRFGSPLPQNLSDFMSRKGLSHRGVFGTHTLRFREHFIRPGQQVYVLGTAKKTHDFLSEHKKRLVERLNELKSSPAGMAEVDLNKDGVISPEEWDRAAAEIEQELLKESLKSGDGPESSDVIVGKGDTEKLFMISDKSQKELIKHLSFESALHIFGGAVLSIYTLWSLVSYILKHY